MLNLFRKKEAPPPLAGVGQRLVYGVGALVGLAVLAPVALFALQAVTSIAMAIVVAIGIGGTLMALPAITRWWKIQVLKMMKAHARDNPVETLQLELINRQRAYEAAQGQAAVITGKRDSLREKLAEYEDKHKVKDDVLDRMITKLSDLVDRLKGSLKRTGMKLGEFERFVEQQADRWEIAKSTGELAAMLRAAQGGDVTSTFLANTAIDSIRTELNTSFAEIDQILDREDVRAVVEGGDTTKLIDITPLPLPLQIAASPETVKVGR